MRSVKRTRQVVSRLYWNLRLFSFPSSSYRCSTDGERDCARDPVWRRKFMVQLIKHGDTTTTRGVVIAVASRMFDKGRRLALNGEEATCGTCKGAFEIVGTATHVRDRGRALVQHGDQVMCPCGKNRVMADSNMHYHNEGSAARPLATPVGSAAAIGAAVGAIGFAPSTDLSGPQTHALSFRFTDSATGAPLAGQPVLITADGQSIHHVTDAQGCTALVYTGNAPRRVECVVLGIDNLYDKDATHG